MTATTKSIVPEFSPDALGLEKWTISSGTPTLYPGALICRNSSGVIVDPTSTTGLKTFGTFVGMHPSNAGTELNSAGALVSAASGTLIVVRRDKRWVVNGETIAEADIGSVCYCLDNQTGYTTSTGRSPMGLIEAVETASGVLVNMYPADQAIADGAITTAKIATGAVDTAQLAADAVDGDKIEDDAIDSEHIAAVSIDDEHIAIGALTPAKRADGVREIADDAAIALVNTDTSIEIADCTAGITVTTASSVAGQRIHIKLLARTSNEIELVAQGGTLTWNAAGEEAFIVRNGANDAWIPFTGIAPATIV